MRLVVEPMSVDDIAQVLDVDRESYTLPWPASAYRREVLHNRNARYFVLRALPDAESPEDGLDKSSDEHRSRLHLGFFKWTARTPGSPTRETGTIVGYAGMWLMIDEAHITTIAVRNAWRGRGLGELLLVTLIEAAADMNILRVTLEVRVSNETAQNLYRKYGFRQEGLRTRYYSDNNEDAYIMTTGLIQEDEYRERFGALVAALRSRIYGDGDIAVDAPALETTAGAD